MKTKDLARIALLLVLISVLLYLVHYAIFRDARFILLYLLYDLAFLPLEVLLVTVIINGLLSAREQQERQRKMNMVIGAFFSAVGQRLLKHLADLASDQAEISARVAIDPAWSEGQIRQAIAWSKNREFKMQPDVKGLGRLRDVLAQHREFMVRLLENPMLLEHEAFSDLLWAVFHLEEELSARRELSASPPADLAHLATDAERAYTHLLVQWLEYMIHLRASYPFLFSFAARTNPLRPDARPEVV